jgi:hypothetical protein
MAKDKCQMLGCDEPPEHGKYCSTEHEVLYEKRMYDAREAEREDKRELERERKGRGDPGMSEREFQRMVL